MPLRPELITGRRADGGLDLLDPLLDRLHRFNAEEAAQLDAPGPALRARLQAGMLFEGPGAQTLRERVLAARQAVPPRPAASDHVQEIDWSQAEDLPDGVSPRWRDGESLRRAAEDRAAGRSLTVLRRFLAPAFCEVLAREAAALPLERLDTDIAHGQRHRVDQRLPALRTILSDPSTRRLLGAVLGVALPDRTVVNAWRYDPGDHLAAHPDGSRYVATFAIGLNAGWRAADGGAIAFGQPRPDGQLDVSERWLPHQGDLALFVPTATSWHAVEPPRRTRWTVSGWWVSG